MEICHITIFIYLGYGCTTKSFTEPSNERDGREYVFTSTRLCVRESFTDLHQRSELANSVFLLVQIIYIILNIEHVFTTTNKLTNLILINYKISLKI